MPHPKQPRQKQAENVLRKTDSETSVTLQIQDAYHSHTAENVTLRPSERDLADVIKAVNLVPKDARLPEVLVDEAATDADFTAAVEKLPLPLRAHLLKILHTPIEQGRIEDPRFYHRSGTATFSNPADEALMRRRLLLRRYDDIRRFRESLNLLLPLIRNEKIKYLRKCLSCGQVFLAVRENQWYWPPSCAKKERQKKWTKRYKEKHLHPYKRPSSRATIVSEEVEKLESVRRSLKLWKKPPETREEKMELAAQSDITLRECEAALKIISSEQKKKRAKTAPKR